MQWVGRTQGRFLRVTCWTSKPAYNMNLIQMIASLLNGTHLVFVFLPFLSPFLTYKGLLKEVFPYVFLFYMLVPMTWAFKDNKCWWTVFTMRFDRRLRESKWGNSAFSAEYLAWVYRPIVELLGWGWNKTSLRKMVYVHWIAIAVTLWSVAFLKIKNFGK